MSEEKRGDEGKPASARGAEARGAEAASAATHGEPGMQSTAGRGASSVVEGGAPSGAERDALPPVGAAPGTDASGAGLAFEQARLAYSIINALLEHTRVTSDLIALMAQVLDEETTRALTQTPYWSAYLDSRRAMERTRREIEEFTEVWTRLAGKERPAV